MKNHITGLHLHEMSRKGRVSETSVFNYSCSGQG